MTLTMWFKSTISNGGFCTGTVLTRDTVLTAARCVTPGLGFQVSKIDSLAVSIPVTNVMYHPQFDVREMNQQRATVDLAILKLAAPLPLFIYTPSLGVSTAVGDRLTIIGYGDNNNQGYLRSATLMVTGKPGRLQIRLFDARTQDASPGLGACTGDFGGPAIKKSGGEVALVGITVWATAPRGERGCGGLTGLVPISPYEDWIIAAVTKLGGSVTSSVSRPTQAPSSAGLQASRGSISVQMKKDGGTYVVPVLINNAITLDFVLDSGAADVSVPADVFRTLVRTGSIKGSDITGKQTYVLADGSKLQSPTFLIRSLKVGDTLVENVRGSVASTEGSLLLGQSFLERFKSWSIDNSNHELLLKQQ